MPQVTVEQAVRVAVDLHGRGRLTDAEAIYRQVLAGDPGRHDVTRLLGLVTAATGRTAEAVALLARAVELAPGVSEYRNDLAVALRMAGRTDDAVAACQRAIDLRPDNAPAHSTLGNCLSDRGDFVAAAASYRRALKLAPGLIEVRRNLGIALVRQGQFADAVTVLSKAVDGDPNSADNHNELGNALAAGRRFPEAAAAFRRAIALRPDFARALNNLGNALGERRQFDEAIACYARSAELDPGFVDVHRNFARSLKDVGQVDEAIARLRSGVERFPGDVAMSDGLLVTLNYAAGSTRQSLRDEAAAWDARHGRAARGGPHGNDRDPGRPVRVGYVSPDLGDHPVGRFVRSLLRRHSAGVEVYCYSERATADPVTAQIRSLSRGWTDTAGESDDDVADAIRRDRIDVLVDLALHTGGNRLTVFARRPAPVQMTFAGYPGTTGMASIDYRISDPHLDPPGPTDADYVEATLRLPDTFWCDGEPDDVVAVGPSPAARDGVVTFGSLNNFCKLNGPLLDLWARVMGGVDRSRLVVLAPDGSARDRMSARLAAGGIDRGRIEFVPMTHRDQYLATYHRIDVGLDAAPYNGHATTFDALWMGVPVVTPVGPTVVGRGGLSQLTNVGLPELVGHSADEYVRIAVALGNDPARAATMRSTMRDRMRASPLTDATKFARGIEALYRSAWRAWCRAE